MITAADESDLHPVIESMYINLDAPSCEAKDNTIIGYRGYTRRTSNPRTPEIGNKGLGTQYRWKWILLFSISGLGITLITAVIVAEQPCVLVTCT